MPDPQINNGDRRRSTFQPEQATARGTLPVPPADQIEGMRVVPWHLVEVQDDEHQLVISIDASPLLTSSSRGVSIAETPTHVTLVVYGTPPPDGPVTAIRVDVVTTVQLTAPLGSRRLEGADNS
jgi:hypothetical protein